MLESTATCQHICQWQGHHPLAPGKAVVGVGNGRDGEERERNGEFLGRERERTKGWEGRRRGGSGSDGTHQIFYSFLGHLPPK